MFRKRASRPKKNYISRTHGHRAHPRTKGKARRGGVGGRTGVSPAGKRGRRGGKVSKSLDGLTHLEVSTHALSPLVPLRPLVPLCFSRRSFGAQQAPPSQRNGLDKKKTDDPKVICQFSNPAEREGLATSLTSFAPLNAFPICSPQGPLQALHSARSYFVAPFVLYTYARKQA